MFKTNPLTIFQNSSTPIARHALSRWARQPQPPWDPPPQRADGSWNGSVADTIQQLYWLWLANPIPDEAAQKGMRWLLENHLPPMRTLDPDRVSYDNLFFAMGRGDAPRLRKLSGVPFNEGCSGFVKTGAALFLASGFGMADEERVTKALATIERIPARRQGWWCSPSCGANLFQAGAAYPDFARGEAMNLALGYLAERQSKNGTWSGGIPFYATFNALSRLEQPQAARLFERALPKVLSSQLPDGGWSRSDSELKTYLVLDAFERTGMAIRL
jgi:hypothetical protein